MTSATEILRRLLDEREVEYEADDDVTRFFDADGVEVVLQEDMDGKLDCLTPLYLTPEQAIAATLGTGTCHDVCNSVAEFTCSACGFNCDLTSWISLFDGDDGRHRHHHHGTPNYCPNCGRKVVDG